MVVFSAEYAVITVKANVRDLQRIEKMLKDLPRGAKSIVVPAVNEWMMGGESGEGGTAYHGLKHYPAFKEWPGGEKYPQRTGYLQRSWKTRGDLYRQTLYNDAPYAPYIHGDDSQTWRAKYGNWRTITEIIESNIKGAIRHARMKLNEWLKKKGYR